MSAPPELLALEIPATVRAILARLVGAGHAAYVVGGAVRDALLGKAPHEWDVTTSARPAQVVALFPHVVPTGLQHGTVTVVQEGLPVEVTTFRGEGAYHDGRRPSEIRFLDDIALDLARRDFTVNAMAFDPVTGRFEDPHGGRLDLQRRTIRAVGAATERFAEDGLRAMRAVRFASVLGFRLERATRRAIPGALQTFRKVAAERIGAELGKLLTGARPRYGLELMRRTGLLAEVLPELLAGHGMRQNRWHRYDVYHHVLRVTDAATPSIVVRLAALLHDIDKPLTARPKEGGEPGEHTFFDHERSGAARAKELCLRLRFPTKVAADVEVLVREHQVVYDASFSDGAIRRLLLRIGPERLDDWYALRRADVIGRATRVEEGLSDNAALFARLDAARAAKPALTAKELALRGEEIAALLGVPPGPEVGRAQRFLLQRVLDEPEANTKVGLTALLTGLPRA